MLTMKQQQQIKEARQDRLEKIETGKLEFIDPQQVSWFLNVYKPMPPWEKEVLKKEWNSYFEDCRDSLEAQLFTEIRKAYKEKDMNRFNELVAQARQMLANGIDEIKKPVGYDPNIWENSQWANEWRMLKSELTRDEREFEMKTGGTW